MNKIEDLSIKKEIFKDQCWKFIYYPNNSLRTTPFTFLNTAEKYALRMLGIKSTLDLCLFLRLSWTELELMLNYPNYLNYSIPKRKKGFRVINAPQGRLNKVQKKINSHLQGVYSCIKHPSVHGFVLRVKHNSQNANIVQNALPHVGKRYLLNLDLKDFFSSIPAQKVYSLFRSPPFGFDESVSEALTYLLTYNGVLPQGVATSPVLSNLICLPLDNALLNYCEQEGITYTRYADDLSFSSNEFITKIQVQYLKHILMTHGFSLNDKKFRLRSKNKKQVVTGIIVNEKVNIDRKTLKKVRAMLHDLNTNGIDHASSRNAGDFSHSVIQRNIRFLNSLTGHINFIGQVRGKDDFLYQKMYNDLIPWLSYQSKTQK